MRKLFSFVAALALVCSASALPFERMNLSKANKVDPQLKNIRVQKVADAPAVVTDATITFNSEVAFIDAIADGGWWQVRGYTADNAYFCSLSNKGERTAVAGTYATADMYLAYTYVRNVATGEKLTTTSADVTVTAVGTNGEYDFVATLVTSGGTFTITMNYRIPTATSEITLTPTDAKYSNVNEAAGCATFTGSVINGTDTTDICFMYKMAGAVVGTYTYEDCDKIKTYIRNSTLGRDYIIYTANINVTLSADSSSYILNADVLCYGGKHFTITMNAGTPKTITFNSEVVFKDVIAAEGWWLVWGYTADNAYYCSLSNKGEKTAVAGTYATADMDLASTYVRNMATGEDLTTISADVTVTAVGTNGEYDFAATLVTSGGTFTITMNYRIPTATSEITLTPTDAKYSNVNEADGYATFTGSVINGTDTTEICFIYKMAGAVVGTYTYKDCKGTYIWNSTLGRDYMIYTANINVTSGADGSSYILNADVLCYGGKHFTITMNTGAPSGVENVEASKVQAKKVIENGQVVIIRDGKRYNMVGAQLD